MCIRDSLITVWGEVTDMLFHGGVSLLTGIAQSIYKTSTVITTPDIVSPSQLKRDILGLDFSELLSEAASHPSQRFVQAVAASSEGSWLRVCAPIRDSMYYGFTMPTTDQFYATL